jgi:two-component system, cell cycle response regulator
MPQDLEPKVLILDDDARITSLLADILQGEGYNVATFNSSKDFLYLARQFVPDLLVLDILMPEVDGFDVCEYFKKDPELKFTRIVVLTAKDTADCRVRSYKVGADAFLTKPLELEEFREVVRSNLSAKKAVDQMVSDLKNETMQDPVTASYSWKYMQRRLAEELKRVERHGRPLSILLVDIDHFRSISVRHGFSFANEILKMVADAVRAKLRQSDLLGRYKEDSFLILLPETSKEAAKTVANRIQKTISQLVFTKKRFSIRAVVPRLEVTTATTGQEVLSNLEAQLRRVQARKASKKSPQTTTD